MIKEPKRTYEAQEPHTPENCKINEMPHCHPSVDCGHYVNSGPGVEGISSEKEREIGPGVK